MQLDPEASDSVKLRAMHCSERRRQRHTAIDPDLVRAPAFRALAAEMVRLALPLGFQNVLLGHGLQPDQGSVSFFWQPIGSQSERPYCRVNRVGSKTSLSGRDATTYAIRTSGAKPSFSHSYSAVLAAC